MPSPVRLIRDSAAAGDWNMAVDEALLASAADGAAPTIRLYQWAPATLSLGYFQGHAERRGHAASIVCPMVRRASGGGAIVHDRELTYSITLPAGHGLTRRSQVLYDAVHNSLISALAGVGVQAERSPGSGKRPASLEPFLCFQRRAEGDLVVGSSKVVGSAQRRSRGAILQHGSILLERSPNAPELAGLADVSGQAFPLETFVSDWLAFLERDLQVSFEPGEIRPDERSTAQAVLERKYSRDVWNLRT